MQELQSLLQAPCCHVMSMPWLQMDGPFPISSAWVLTALAPHPQHHSLGLPEGTNSIAVRSDIFFFFLKREIPALTCAWQTSYKAMLYFKTV